MAEATVSASAGVMNPVLAKLTVLLSESYEYHKLLAKPVSRKMRSMRDELTLVKGLIDKLAESEELDPLVKGWMKQAREMTYDLEDFIDKLMHRHQLAPAGSFRSKLLLFSPTQVRQTEIQDLEARIVDLSERRSRYKIDDAATGGDPRSTSAASMSSWEPRLRVPLAKAVAETGPVGIDGPRETLIQRLTADGQMQLKVVAIVGMGGVGKTTLARELYHSLAHLFNCQAFVSLSQNTDVTKLLMTIFSQVSASEDARNQKLDIEQLIPALRDSLKDKRYFIIIDDIWNEAAWRLIKCALPDNTCGSIVLVTTRILEIAHSCCYPIKDGVFRMEPLMDVEARKLFFNTIFHSEDECPPELVNVSNHIIRACGGLPLAIKVIASILSTKSHTVEEWERFLRSITSSLQESTGLEGTLNLSYSVLPFQLRTCLLYLSMFPEDYLIDRKQLVRRWIAERFIIEESGKSLEEVGECYLNELIDRSWVQPVGTQYDGHVHACRVHDIVLTFFKSKSIEENFVIRYGEHLMSRLQDRVRRLSLTMGDHEDTFRPSEITTHVRSLIVFGSKDMPVLANFQVLRVLDLDNCEVLESRYLRDIGKLYLLKYLRIQTSSVIELPEEIGESRYLQTLDLAGAQICKLPESVVRLKELSYLLVNNAILPGGIGKLQALRELSCVKVDSSCLASSLQELGSLTALRILGLNWCIDTDKKDHADGLVYSLNKVSSSNLQSLYIESADGCSLDFLLKSLSISSYCLREFRMKSEYHFPMIPEWISSLINLTFLEINIDPVEEKVFQILGKLPALLVMLLSSRSSSPEQRLLISNNGFDLLRQFGFTCLNTLPMLMFEPGAMPWLKKLELGFCAQGKWEPSCLDFGIEHLTSLEHLAVEINCRGAKSSDVKAAEDGIKNAVSAHPSHPKLELQRKDEEHMVKDEREIIVHGDEEEECQSEGVDDVEHEVVVE